MNEPARSLHLKSVQGTTRCAFLRICPCQRIRVLSAYTRQFNALTVALSPILRSIRQKEFYTEPRFHASIAWALLDSNSTAECPFPTDELNIPTEASSTITTAIHTKTFPSIPHLPTSLIPALNANYSSQLTKVVVGVFDVTEVRVKIGKWVGGWVLEGTGGT